MNHLKGVFVGCQESLIAAPTFDEREAARLARCVGQSIDDILMKSTTTFHRKLEMKFSDTATRQEKEDDKLGKLSCRIRHRRPAGSPPPKLSIPWPSDGMVRDWRAATLTRIVAGKDELLHGTRTNESANIHTHTHGHRRRHTHTHKHNLKKKRYERRLFSVSGRMNQRSRDRTALRAPPLYTPR